MLVLKNKHKVKVRPMLKGAVLQVFGYETQFWKGDDNDVASGNALALTAIITAHFEGSVNVDQIWL